MDEKAKIQVFVKKNPYKRTSKSILFTYSLPVLHLLFYGCEKDNSLQESKDKLSESKTKNQYSKKSIHDIEAFSSVLESSPNTKTDPKRKKYAYVGNVVHYQEKDINAYAVQVIPLDKKDYKPGYFYNVVYMETPKYKATLMVNYSATDWSIVNANFVDGELPCGTSYIQIIPCPCKGHIYPGICTCSTKPSWSEQETLPCIEYKPVYFDGVGSPGTQDGGGGGSAGGAAAIYENQEEYLYHIIMNGNGPTNQQGDPIPIPATFNPDFTYTSPGELVYAPQKLIEIFGYETDSPEADWLLDYNNSYAVNQLHNFWENNTNENGVVDLIQNIINLGSGNPNDENTRSSINEITDFLNQNTQNGTVDPEVKEFVNGIIEALSESPISTYTPNDYPGRTLGYSFEWWKDNNYIENSNLFDLPSDSTSAPDEKPNAREIFLFSLFPAAAIAHVENSRTALNKAAELVSSGTLTGIEDGKADAFRHSFWNALGTAEFGETIMKLFADAHEWQKSGLAVDMDLFNNQRGRGIGTGFDFNDSDDVIEDTIMQALLNGELKYINNGVLTPTNQ